MSADSKHFFPRFAWLDCHGFRSSRQRRIARIHRNREPGSGKTQEIEHFTLGEAHDIETLETVVAPARGSAKHDVEAVKARPTYLELPNGRKAQIQGNRADYAISIGK